jgi:hypothetical protein
MMVKSGFMSMPSQFPQPVDRNRRTARDRAECRADRAEHRDEDHVEGDRQHRHRDAEAQRCAGITSGAEGAAQHEEHHHAEDAHEHRAQERQRLRLHVGSRIHEDEQRLRREVPDHREDDRQSKRSQERLIDDAVDLVGLVRTSKARHQHGHASEE